MMPASRAEALAVGAKHYFTGIPCKNGHVTKRYATGACYGCLRASNEKRDDPEWRRTYSHAHYMRNRSKVLTRTKAWANNNKDSRLASVHNHRAHTKYGLSGNVSGADIATLREQQTSCYWCCAKQSRLELDHIVPLELGGAHTLTNLCLACTSCNRRKAFKMPVDFVAGLFGGIAHA